MKYCENLYCETPDEPIERISDYRILDGAVICTHCYELELEEEAIQRQEEELDAQEELAANQPESDYELA